MSEKCHYLNEDIIIWIKTSLFFTQMMTFLPKKWQPEREREPEKKKQENLVVSGKQQKEKQKGVDETHQ